MSSATSFAEQVAQQLQHLCQDLLLSQLPEQARPVALAAAGGVAQDAVHQSEQDDEMHEADVQQCTTTVPQGEALLLVFSNIMDLRSPFVPHLIYTKP